MNEDVVDLNEVLERVQGDKELLAELFDIFLEDCPTRITAIKEAIQAKDVTKLKDAAHSLKGASGNISAKRLHQLFLKMEQAAKNSDLTGVEVLLREADLQVAELKNYCATFKKDLKRT